MRAGPNSECCGPGRVEKSRPADTFNIHMICKFLIVLFLIDLKTIFYFVSIKFKLIQFIKFNLNCNLCPYMSLKYHLRVAIYRIF